jgi:hypothetical protein
MLHGLPEHVGKQFVVKDAKSAGGRNLANRSGHKPVLVIAIARLDKDGFFWQALGEHFSIEVDQLNAWKDANNFIATQN